VDRSVFEPVGPESLRVLCSDRRRQERQFSGVVAQGVRACVEIGVAVVVLRVCCQLVCCALVTEVVGM